MLQERTSHRAVTLRNGKVLVSGGTINDKHFSSTELYDPVTNTFSEGADMKYPHSSHTITKLKDGNVLVVAGYRSNARFSDKCEIYYPDKDEWQEIAPLNTARAGHSTFQLGNGDILVIGGVSTDIEGHPIVSCELYSFSSNTWTEVGQLLTRREGFTAFAVDEDNILLAGGGFWDANTKVELFNTRTFTSLRQPNTLYDYQWAKALDLENGLVLLHGHSFYNYSDGSRINSQVYNKKTKEWMLTNYLPFEKKSIYNIGSSGLLLEANKAILVSDNKESVIFNLKLE